MNLRKLTHLLRTIVLDPSEKRPHPVGLISIPVLRRGSALVISMFITMIIVMIAVYLLEKIVPTSRDVRGIENGNLAYYSAETAMNEGLFTLSSLIPWAETSITYTGSANAGLWYQFQISASGKVIPTPGKGTSEYDPNWNRVGVGAPIQLSLPKSLITWENVTLRLRVPNLDHGSVIETLSGGASTPIINWIISGESDSLIASGSQIMASNISRWDDSGGTIIKFTDPSFQSGMTPSGSGYTLKVFYGASWANCAVNQCTLKLSFASPLLLSTPAGTNAPYLEYRLDMGTNPTIPLQYATLSAKGYASGFRKNIQRSIRQQTTNEAADFTVFQ